MNKLKENDRKLPGINIARRRRERGMTQQEFAQVIGISRSHLAAIETGRKLPSLDLLFQIARVLEVTPDRLFEIRLQHTKEGNGQ